MTQQKILLIGVDQSISYLLNTFTNESTLPNIKNLMDTGTCTEGLSCVPCDTPTNWTTIATGATTPVHGATSFYTHIPGEELDYGATRRSRSQLKKYATAEYIWETADRHKIPSFVMNYPAGWPAQLNHGIMSLFTWPIPESFPQILKQKKEVSFSVDSPKSKFKITNNKFSLRIAPKITIEFKLKDKRNIEFSFNGQTGNIERGQWSEWIRCVSKYRRNELPALVRIYINQIAEDGSGVEVIASPLFNIKGWTSPDSFGGLLVKNVLFSDNPTKTEIGYTFEGELEDVLEYAELETQAISNAIYFAKKQINWELCYFHIHHLDTVNHSCLAHLHKDYPKYDEDIAEKTIGHVRRAYSIVDNMVGDLMERVVDEDTTIIYISDHGAIPCWRIVNLLKPLVDAGLMVYKKEGNRYYIDWSRSQVFPYFEPTYIWVNLKGRDPQGIVSPSDYESVRDHVIDALSNLKDPENNKSIMDLVMRKEDRPELYQNGDRIGDIVYFLNSPFNIFDGDLGEMNAAQTTLLD
ncbi:MAG: alkaline phosphatase family protein, partial [Promethearchaeota archaeon]